MTKRAYIFCDFRNEGDADKYVNFFINIARRQAKAPQAAKNCWTSAA